MRKQIFRLLFLLILCQANLETEDHNFQSKIIRKNVEEIRKAHYFDNDKNYLLLLQQQVREPNFHKNKHQAIGNMRQIIDTNFNIQKIQDTNQTKEKFKYHINLLESAETEEEIKVRCDLLDNLAQSLIISANIINQPAPQYTQPIIAFVEDTTRDKPEQELTILKEDKNKDQQINQDINDDEYQGKRKEKGKEEDKKAKKKKSTKDKKDKKVLQVNNKLKHIAKDKWHSPHRGKIGQVRFNAGQGAFSKHGFDKKEKNTIGQNLGQKEQIKATPNIDLNNREVKGFNTPEDGKETQVSQEQSENDLVKDPPLDALTQQKMILSSFNGKIQLEKEYQDDELGADLQEYGYGFYIRYLTQYPTQMLEGNREAWYIIARLTKNQNYTDVRMGDRILAIWQGKAIYLPATTDIPKNPNFHQTVPYGDIEGVWTFIYFSYSLTLQKATFLLKYDGNDQIFKRDFKCNHGAITYFKFIVGGASPPYSGFNGQIANTAIKFGQGAYIDDLSKWAQHLNSIIPPPPADDNSFKFIDILKGVDEAPFEADKSAPPYEIWAIDTESMFKSEYSVTGWIRWDSPSVGPWYNVWRLSIYKEEDNLNTKRLGDRDHTLFKNLDNYHFTSYSYSNINGGGNANVWLNIPHGSLHLQWHFIFSGYSRKLRQMYHHITFIDEQKEMITPNINHYVLYKHYFQFGKDFKKWERIHNGFQGIASKIQLNYGDGAYQIKPFNKPDTLFYSVGMEKYHPSFEFRQVKPAELKDPIPSSANQDQPIFDIQLEAKDNIRGLQEYGWTTWVRWMRTGPTNLIWMAPHHLIGRLTTNKNHQDKGLGDRTLSCWQVAGQYHFRTYTPRNNDVAINMGYKFPDGSWNLISWTYKKNSARAIVWMNGKYIDNQELKVVHQPVGEFLRFVSLKEFAYRAFNGFYAKVSLRLGDGAYIDEKQFQILLAGELELLKSLIPSQQRISVAIQEDLIQVKYYQVLPDIIIPEDIVDGKDEYSVSGWAKYVDSAPGPLNLVIRVSTNAPAVLNDLAAPGDRTFGIWKGEGFYHFCTYTSDQENGGKWDICQDSINFNILHKNWVFFYFGYSRTLKKAFAYIKYATKEDKLTFNVLHQVPYKFTIKLKKDQWHYGFQGAMQNWYLNVGAGSYKESGYHVEEEGDQTFGFGGRDRPPIKQWKFLGMFEQNWRTEEKVGVQVEYKNDDSIDGLQEYGYGFWFRFLWNGPDKIVNKPNTLALSRLTINENYEKNSRAGDRQLAVSIGSPYFHFTTSELGNAQYIGNNVYYNQMLDGQWNLLYYGYKRTDKGGKVLGHILFDGQVMRSTNFSSVNHVPVQDFLYLSVGSYGYKLLKYYYQFNGQISDVRLVLAEGGLIETSDDLNKFAGKKPELPMIPQVKETIFKEPQEMKRGENWVAPFLIEYYNEFAGADEYVVSIWFKWSKIAIVEWEIIYSLTYNKFRDDQLRPGDRVLSMYQSRHHKIFFRSYSTPNSHDSFAQVYTECSVPYIDQKSWVYGYYAYSRKQASLISYLKTRTSDWEKKIDAMHRVPKYFGLYVGKDGIHTPYNGKFAHLYLWSGTGSYRERDYLSFQPYLAGAELPDFSGVLFEQKPEKEGIQQVPEVKDTGSKDRDYSIVSTEGALSEQGQKPQSGQ